MPIDRIPLTQLIETRDGTLTKDSKNVNGYFESSSGRKEFIKRPGLINLNPSPALASSDGQGVAYYDGSIFAVVNNTVYQIDPTTYATTTIGTITGTVKQCYFTITSSSNYLFFHNQTNCYTIAKTSHTLATVTTPVTSGIVPGICYLDSYVFIGDPNGRIYSCAVGDPTSWNALDYISAEQEPDNSIGICKHLNYVLAFGQWSLEFFYDAANATASPLAAATPYKIEIGCVNGNSIVQFEQTVAWIGVSQSTGTGIYLLDGTSPSKISTPHIDRILGNSNFSKVTAYAMKINGHMFYLFSLHDLNTTLVFDFNEQVWHNWTMWAVGTSGSGVPGIYAEQYFRPSYYTRVNNTIVLMDDDNGSLYSISDTQYTDAGAPIYYKVITNILDSGTTKRKFYNRVELVGDKVPATLQVRHTGDDYKSWSNYRSVDLNKERAQIHQNGQDRRRAWEFLCTENQPIRLVAAEVDFNIGEIETGQVAPHQAQG